MTCKLRTATVGIYELTMTLVGTSYCMQGGPHGSHTISAAHTSSERLDAHWAPSPPLALSVRRWPEEE